MADQSIFDLLQPPSTEGIRGALLGGLQDISNFFAKETPALLRDPTQDIGVGEAAILGAISGLGAPGRRREEARKQAVQSAQAFFPSLSPESQQQVVSAVAPGLELKKPDLTAPQKATLDEAMSIIGDENETPETRQSALEVISTLAPETTDAIQRFAFTETGKPLDEGEQLVFQTNLQRIFTPDSIRKYLTSVPPGKSLRFGDVSLLERLPQKGQARGAGGSLRDQIALRDFLKVESLKAKARAEGKELSDLEAFRKLHLTGGRAANLQRFVGISTTAPFVPSLSTIFLDEVEQALRQDFNVELSKFGTLSASAQSRVLENAQRRAEVKVQALKAAGLPVLEGGEPVGFRSPPTLMIEQMGIDERRRVRTIESEIQRRRAGGDARPEAVLQSEIEDDIDAGKIPLLE